jgi:hypothetical protein
VAQDANVDFLQGYRIGRPAVHCLPVVRQRQPREAA